MAAVSLLLVPLVLFFALAVGAVLLRAAVSLANKVLGPTALPEITDSGLPIGPAGFEPNASVENPFAIQTKMPNALATPEENPYASPAVAGTGAIPSAPRTKKAIQDPNFGKAMGIVFLQSVATGVVNFLIGLLGNEVDPIFLLGPSLILGILITVSIYAGMLPTSFGKAALVYLFQVLIALAIAAGIIAVVFAIQAATGSL